MLYTNLCYAPWGTRGTYFFLEVGVMFVISYHLDGVQCDVVSLDICLSVLSYQSICLPIIISMMSTTRVSRQYFLFAGHLVHAAPFNFSIN